MTKYPGDTGAGAPVPEQERRTPAGESGWPHGRRQTWRAAEVDQVLDDSFPASDPPPWTSSISRVVSPPKR